MINKCLNRDWKLKQNDNCFYDFDNNFNDVHLVEDVESLKNGIKFAVLTRFNELYSNPTYHEWGNRSFELLKINQNNMTKYKLELYINEVLERIRRVRSIDLIDVIEKPFGYNVTIQVTSICDDFVNVPLELVNQTVPTSFTLKECIGTKIILQLHDLFENPLPDMIVKTSTNTQIITDEDGLLNYNNYEEGMEFIFDGFKYYTNCLYKI